MIDRNIVLIGFMGVGKTSVGKLLAEKMKYSFIDTDKLIESRTNMLISDIFERYGEKYFRKIESEVVEEASKAKGAVIATGGGVVLNPSNIDNLKKDGFIIFLDASPRFIYNNIINEGHRPLLNEDNKLEKIEQLLHQRKDYYNCYHSKIDVDELSVGQVADKVLDILKGNG